MLKLDAPSVAQEDFPSGMQTAEDPARFSPSDGSSTSRPGLTQEDAPLVTDMAHTWVDQVPGAVAHFGAISGFFFFAHSGDPRSTPRRCDQGESSRGVV